ncbi:MAG: divalent metal cation transporter, partial [Chromatiaceae bacterium]
LYAGALGEWSRPLIAVAALTTMFSTTLAVTDAYPRVITALIRAARADERGVVLGPPEDHRWPYVLSLVVVLSGALTLIYLAGERFTTFVDLATTISFLSAPVLAWLTLRVVTDEHMPPAARPGPVLLGLAWVGLIFLISFSLVWAGWRILG